MFNDLSDLLKVIFFVVLGLAWIAKLLYENFWKPLQGQQPGQEPPPLPARDEEAIRSFLEQIRGAAPGGKAAAAESREAVETASPPAPVEASPPPPPSTEHAGRQVEPVPPRRKRLRPVMVEAAPAALKPPEDEWSSGSVHKYMESLQTLDDARPKHVHRTASKLPGLNANLRDALLAEFILSPPRALAMRRNRRR